MHPQDHNWAIIWDFTNFPQACLWDNIATDQSVSFPHYEKQSDLLFKLVWSSDRNHELIVNI